ncbi:hypothetical protein PanWU01x14_162020 [Parasponia andersonii]|uniref:Uncharacterized protein n=1 Tax=Parasponia andersonii TaxID=3476 RepID=A0A2P5CDD9_PARAD|nr:hypothetical protein PanWU01x14_162020 [Parasponia andersonii]
MRGFAGIVGGPPCVEHVEWGPSRSLPRPERLEGSAQNAAREYGFVDMSRVAPRDREGPVGGAVVAYGLLENTRVVRFRRLHEVVDGVGSGHFGEDRVYSVDVMEG